MYGALALIYDQLMAHVDYAGWVTFAEQAFTRYQVKPETVLDLACGTGGITSRLLAKGYQVTGVDISPDMLAVCADRNQQYLTTGKLALIAQDMRLVTLPRPVDAVVCFLDSLNYLASPADLQTVFQRIAQVLRPGGVLVADLHTEYKLATLVANTTFTEVDAELAYIWYNLYLPETKSVEMDLTFFVSRPTGFYQRFEEFHCQRWFSPAEITGALKIAGLEYLGLFADLKWEPPGPQAERYFLVARQMG